MRIVVCLFALLAFAACSKPAAVAPPVEVDGPVDCGGVRVESKWQCGAGNVIRCASFAGWKCPEPMTCVFTPEDEKADDAPGTCQPATRP